MPLTFLLVSLPMILFGHHNPLGGGIILWNHLGDVTWRCDATGGMRRRLSVAIALLGDPQVVYLDEPTTGTPHFLLNNRNPFHPSPFEAILAARMHRPIALS